MTDTVTIETTDAQPAILETRDDDASVIVRLVPFGVPARVGANALEVFTRDARLELPDQPVPVQTSHELNDTLNRVGILTEIEHRDDGAYGRLELIDSPDGREIRARLELRAVTGVSIGFKPLEHTREGKLITRSAVELDHVALVPRPAYVGAQVTEVRQEDEMETIETPAPPVDLSGDVLELRESLDALAAAVSDLSAPDPVETRSEFTAEEVWVASIAKSVGATIQNRALADVVADLGTDDASGLTPDFYWAGGLQHATNRRRPLFASMGAAVFPTYGNNLDTAKVTQQATAETGTAQKAEIGGTALQVAPVSYPIEWHKVGLDLAIELISQGNPDAMGVAGRSMLRAYARAVELDAYAKAAAAATATGAVLDTSSMGALVAQLMTTGHLIEDATDEFGGILAVSNADYVAIASMEDADGRRQFAVSGGTNADGVAPAASTSMILAGDIRILRSYAVTVPVQYNAESLRGAEKNPMEVTATNVEKMGIDKGYIGATAIVHWDEGVYDYAVSTQAQSGSKKK